MRNKLNKELKQHKSYFEWEKLRNKDNKKFYRHVNQFLPKNKRGVKFLIHDDNNYLFDDWSRAECFNKYFASVFSLSTLNALADMPKEDIVISNQMVSKSIDKIN